MPVPGGTGSDPRRGGQARRGGVSSSPGPTGAGARCRSSSALRGRRTGGGRPRRDPGAVRGGRIARYKHPRDVVYLEALPKNAARQDHESTSPPDRRRSRRGSGGAGRVTMSRYWILAAGIAGFAGVAIGAAGAHGPGGKVPPPAPSRHRLALCDASWLGAPRRRRAERRRWGWGWARKGLARRGGRLLRDRRRAVPAAASSCSPSRKCRSSVMPRRWAASPS